ncbi:hypothetical protein Acr_10g0009780 [Actinidia rufa]|uniref:CCHC-type domain-containing protein n=1 Tax=Actinidia rufa TaxID=165716 RepID=A0A7J0FAF5_9ERIC|nr:hypothetical protein Acr_10g0009780 [Actinidia rufa]
MMKRPMAIPEIILELQDQSLRESAIRCLSTFLLEKREEDPEDYHRTAFLLYHSCCTLTILLQEVLVFSHLVVDGGMTIRASCVLNFVVPLIRFEVPSEIYENVRAVALSVIGILCQAREPEVIRWALESNMVEVCWISIEIGSELSKVVRLAFLYYTHVSYFVPNRQSHCRVRYRRAEQAYACCSSRQYGAPAPNRVGNGVQTRPHAPPEHRRVRSISATRTGRSHALPLSRGRTHAPARAREEAARAPTLEEEFPCAEQTRPRKEAEVKEEVIIGGTGKGRWRSQARGRTVRCFYCDQEGHIKRDCPKYKAQDQSSNTAATAVMVVDEDEFDIQRDAALMLVEELSEFPRENKEMLWGKKTGRLYRLRGVSKQGELLSDMGPMVLERRMDKGSNRCTEVRKASAGTRVVQPVHNVHREAQRKETKSILRSCTGKGAATPKRVSFALDLICGGDLSSCVHKGGEMEPRQPPKRDGATTTSKVTYFAAPPSESYGGAGSEAVKKDNLKTSDYPPIGMHILEAILQDDLGMSYICSPNCDHLLKNLMNTWDHLVTFLAADQDSSPRLLFHIIRGYVLLCTHVRGFSIVLENLPDSITNGSFDDLIVEFPVIRNLLQQLLVSLGKIGGCFPDFLPDNLLLH